MNVTAERYSYYISSDLFGRCFVAYNIAIDR